MTSPSPVPSAGGPQSPRSLVAIGLVGYVALAELFGFIVWIGADGTFTARSAVSAQTFLDLVLNALPIVAVLVATKIQPAIAMARTIVLVALIEYGVSIVLGLLTFLIGIGDVFDSTTGLFGTQALLLGLGKLVLIAIVGFITYKTFTDMGGRVSMPHATYGGYPAPPQPQYPPQPGQAYPPQPQPGQYPGAQQ